MIKHIVGQVVGRAAQDRGIGIGLLAGGPRRAEQHLRHAAADLSLMSGCALGDVWEQAHRNGIDHLTAVVGIAEQAPRDDNKAQAN